MDWSSGKIAVISSLGVVISGSGREDPSTLIAAADEAFYRAKPRVGSVLNSVFVIYSAVYITHSGSSGYY
ncbi:hypothetical protein [Nitrosospira sp. Nsp2]|uniref:hypothetical protein n=1 Tax=Nitrosospira sp. Nsp2 TaxID=136548 RepID=UPI000D327F63|nr:hypothetical protein [Nitrosospira sp. Nsp2]